MHVCLHTPYGWLDLHTSTTLYLRVQLPACVLGGWGEGPARMFVCVLYV